MVYKCVLPPNISSIKHTRTSWTKKSRTPVSIELCTSRKKCARKTGLGMTPVIHCSLVGIDIQENARNINGVEKVNKHHGSSYTWLFRALAHRFAKVTLGCLAEAGEQR